MPRLSPVITLQLPLSRNRKHLIIQVITFLNHIHNFALQLFGGGRDLGDGLMEIGIKFLFNLHQSP